MINPQVGRSLAGASLTRGLANGPERFPAEMPLLERLGATTRSEVAGLTPAEHGYHAYPRSI